jgi:hypothetical protein
MKNKKLNQKILENIKLEKIKPKWHFTAGAVLMGLGLSLTFVIAIFFLNVFLFRMRFFGPLGFLMFGKFGFKSLLLTTPWQAITVTFLALTLAIGGIILGLKMLKKSNLTYKLNYLGLVLGAFVFIFITSFALDQTGFNEKFGQKRAPALYGPPHIHEKIIESKQPWIIGRVLEVYENKLLIQSFDNQKIVIIYDENTLMPFNSNFEKKEIIKAVGEFKNDTFYATGIIRDSRGQHRSKVKYF